MRKITILTGCLAVISLISPLSALSADSKADEPKTAYSGLK